jgi:uncharacterized membrane protein YdbT with pleckstrin-like domain
MSYVEENLMPNERVIFIARIHDAIFLAPLLFLFLTVVVFLGGWVANMQRGGSGLLLMLIGVFLLGSTVLLAMKALVIKLTTELAVTNQRILAKTGLIKRRTLELLLHKVESVGVNQNLGGRLMGFGTITITGTGGTREGFIGIASALTVRKRINQVIQEQTKPS